MQISIPLEIYNYLLRCSVTVRNIQTICAVEQFPNDIIKAIVADTVSYDPDEDANDFVRISDDGILIGKEEQDDDE